MAVNKFTLICSVELQIRESLRLSQHRGQLEYGPVLHGFFGRQTDDEHCANHLVIDHHHKAMVLGHVGYKRLSAGNLRVIHSTLWVTSMKHRGPHTEGWTVFSICSVSLVQSAALTAIVAPNAERTKRKSLPNPRTGYHKEEDTPFLSMIYRPFSAGHIGFGYTRLKYTRWFEVGSSWTAVASKYLHFG